MSIENGERMLRFMEKDAKLRKQVSEAGAEKFQEVTAEAGASCTAYEVVRAMIRRKDSQ